MAVGGLLVFDAEPKLTRAIVAERIAERSHLVPRLRQRLEEPPLGIASPVWTDDTGFDLDWHVRQASLPEPGGASEIGAFVGREFSHRLDRSRPLWEATFVEGMEGGRRGLQIKVHHAVVDGLAALGMAPVFVDLPVQERDLLARISALSTQTSQLKESAAVRAGAHDRRLGLGAAARLRHARPRDGELARVQSRCLQHPRPLTATIPPWRPDGRGLSDSAAEPVEPGPRGWNPQLQRPRLLRRARRRDLDPPLSTVAAGLRAALAELQNAVIDPRAAAAGRV